MEISNNYQINFQGLKFKNNYCPSVEKEVKDILYKKLPKEEVDSFFSILKKSPVETTLGVADGKGIDRLDATVYYKKTNSKTDSFDYIEEGKFRNFFSIKPRKFMHDVLMKVESFEESFQIGRYANR